MLASRSRWGEMASESTCAVCARAAARVGGARSIAGVPAKGSPGGGAGEQGLAVGVEGERADGLPQRRCGYLAGVARLRAACRAEASQSGHPLSYVVAASMLPSRLTAIGPDNRSSMRPEVPPARSTIALPVEIEITCRSRL